MSKYCSKYGIKVTYLDCMECDDKICKKGNKKEKPKSYGFHIMNRFTKVE